MLQRLGLCLLLLVLYSSFKLLLLTNEGVSSSPEDVQAVQKHEDTTPGSTSKPKHDLSINDTAYLHCPGPLQQVPPTLRELCPTCPQYTCSHFLLNPHTHPDHKKAKSLQEKYTLHKVPEADYIKLTENCTAFKSSNKYTLHPADEEEGNYSIAFNILMHKDVEQVERLLRAIYRPQNFYCIHVDGKSPNVTLSAMRAITKCFPNVILASKMERVVYAGQSRLQADINCMSDLVKHSNQWKYLINVAGQAFPLKTNSEMVKILKIYNGANDIEGIYGKRVLRSRFLNEWLEVDVNTSRPTMKKTGKQNPPTPFDIDIVRGSAYGVFSREFVEFLLNDKKARALLTWSKHTWSPDEHYWATLHHTYSNPHINAPGSYKGRFKCSHNIMSVNYNAAFTCLALVALLAVN